MGAQTRLQKYVGAIECDTGTSAPVLHAQRLRTLQDAESLPKSHLEYGFSSNRVANISFHDILNKG